MRGRRSAAVVIGAALALAVGCAGGGAFDGDPGPTVADAAAATLTVPLGLAFELTLDPDRIVEAARATGDDDAAMGFGLLGSQPLVLSGDAVIADGVVHVAAALDGQEAGWLWMEDDRPPMVRLDPEATRGIALLSFVRGMVPQLFTGEWVEVTDGPVPSGLRDLGAGMDDLRQEIGATSPEALRQGLEVTYLETDHDGWRFEVRPGAEVEDVPEEVSVHVWVEDGRIQRLRADLLLFLLADEPDLDEDIARDAVVLDVRRSDVPLPERPEPTGSVSFDRLDF